MPFSPFSRDSFFQVRTPARRLPSLICSLTTSNRQSLDASSTPTENGKIDEEVEEKEEVRKTALEFMIGLSAARALMFKKQEGWVSASLECMSEFRDTAEMMRE